MKKMRLLAGGIVLAGLLAVLVTGPFLSGRTTPVRSTMRSAEEAASFHPNILPEEQSFHSTSDALSRLEPLDEEDDGPLLSQAGVVLDLLAQGDYEGLSRQVHPLYGVTFTPYSTVDPESDLCFLPHELASAGEDGQTYLWGFTDGRGEHISLSVGEYMARYVWNTDYREAPVVSVDRVAASGNALENVKEVFPRSRFVEYHFPALDPRNGGLDWCSLKLVFFPFGEQWKLVGLIHSEWTI